MKTNKKYTDFKINTWIIKCLIGPFNRAPLLAFALGYFFPITKLSLLSLIPFGGVGDFVASRTTGSNFEVAAFSYWLIFLILLPFHLIWIYRQGIKGNMPNVLRELAKKNLHTGAWNPRIFNAKTGGLAFFIITVFVVMLIIMQIITAQEPSYCVGCETSSVFGFFFINWLGMNLMIFAGYFSFSYFLFWKELHTARE